MKNTFTLIILLFAGAFALTSCDNGNADIVLRDSAPVIELVGAPGVVESGAPLQFTAEIVDGVTEELSKSPLASYTYILTDTTAGTEAVTFSESLSGRMATVPVSVVTDDLEKTVYLVEFIATDQAGLSNSQEFYTEVIDCPDPAATIGVIGSAAGSWDLDVDMTQDAVNPYQWTLTIDLIDGEAKFRQDNGWTINWGASAFPSGNGTQDGPNIPVTAGNYDITFNTCTGAYTFEAN